MYQSCWIVNLRGVLIENTFFYLANSVEDTHWLLDLNVPEEYFEISKSLICAQQFLYSGDGYIVLNDAVESVEEQ